MLKQICLEFPGLRSGLTTIAAVTAGVILLAGCSKKIEKAEDIRPVRAVTITSTANDIAAEYAGEVRPRVESRLGFRVGGKVIARKVDVGNLVQRGQVLMQLDPQDLALAQQQAKAGLAAAESNLELAKADLKRYQELREKNFVAVAVLDGKQTAFKAAQASYEQAVIAYKNQSNQTGYATLVSDADGVVTAINAEVGQVVAAGTPVVQVAKSGDIDVVVGIPEDKVNAIREMSDIHIRMWANPKEEISATLRELSPVADPVTRTYTAKLALVSPPKDVKLGMTAYVTVAAKNVQTAYRLPMSALYQHDNRTAVWLIENGTVKLVPVQVVGSNEQEILIANGVKAGQTVVTAGVNLLKAGQKVTVLAMHDGARQVAKAEVSQ